MIIYVEQPIVSGLSRLLEQMERELANPKTLPTKILGPSITKTVGPGFGPSPATT